VEEKVHKGKRYDDIFGEKTGTRKNMKKRRERSRGGERPLSSTGDVNQNGISKGGNALTNI